MRAMILAAGEGRRLRPLTETRPKSLVEVGGKALIEYAIGTLARSGITDVIVNLHHLGAQVRAHLGDGERFGVNLRYSVEETLLGSGGGIVHARSLLGEEPFLTLNADTIIEIDLRSVVDFHRRSAAIATLVLREDARMDDYGIIQTDRLGRVAAFLEHRRPGAPAALERYMYTGVQVLDCRVFDYMPAAGAFSITSATYPRLLAADEPVYGYRFDGRWLTVGTPDELARASDDLARRPLDSRERSTLS